MLIDHLENPAGRYIPMSVPQCKSVYLSVGPSATNPPMFVQSVFFLPFPSLLGVIAFWGRSHPRELSTPAAPGVGRRVVNTTFAVLEARVRPLGARSVLSTAAFYLGWDVALHHPFLVLPLAVGCHTTLGFGEAAVVPSGAPLSIDGATVRAVLRRRRHGGSSRGRSRDWSSRGRSRSSGGDRGRCRRNDWSSCHRGSSDRSRSCGGDRRRCYGSRCIA